MTLDRAIGNFQEGIASGVAGFAYAAIIEALLKGFLGPYIPTILISGAMFIVGIVTSAETFTERSLWFILGVVFITMFLDPLSLLLGLVLFILGYFVRQRYS